VEYIGITLTVCLSIPLSVCLFAQMLRKCNSLSNELIRIKRYTVVVYDLRICMKEDNHCQKSFKGVNSREISCNARWGYPLCCKSQFYCFLLPVLPLSHDSIICLSATLFSICLFTHLSFRTTVICLFYCPSCFISLIFSLSRLSFNLLQLSYIV